MRRFSLSESHQDPHGEAQSSVGCWREASGADFGRSLGKDDSWNAVWKIWTSLIHDSAEIWRNAWILHGEARGTVWGPVDTRCQTGGHPCLRSSEELRVVIRREEENHRRLRRQTIIPEGSVSTAIVGLKILSRSAIRRKAKPTQQDLRGQLHPGRDRGGHLLDGRWDHDVGAHGPCRSSGGPACPWGRWGRGIDVAVWGQFDRIGAILISRYFWPRILKPAGGWRNGWRTGDSGRWTRKEKAKAMVEVESRRDVSTENH